MENNSTTPEIIANKWDIGSISMRENGVFLVVAMDAEMDNNQDTMMDTANEGDK